MPRRTSGSVFRTATGYGIRWPEDGRRPQQTGFKTKTEARRWFAENVASRLDRGAPSPEITFDAFCDLFLERHGATVAERTRRTLAERLGPARAMFGGWTLAELEGAADDVSRWRAGLSDGARFRHTGALRQALAAAVRWRFMVRNPAVEAGRNPDRGPRSCCRSRPRRSTRSRPSSARSFGPLVTFAAETGLRTNEWSALERRDIDRVGTGAHRPTPLRGRSV